MKISSVVCFLVKLLCFQVGANAYLGCRKPSPCLYYTDYSAIKAIDVNASTYPDTKLYTVANVPAHAIDIDMTADMIYWSEQSPSWKICRMNLNNGSIEELITKDVGEVEGISVDWINRNFYWTDFTYERIEVSTLDGLYRKTLFDKDDESAGNKILNNPKAIAVHPAKGYVFWTDYHYYYPQLARSTLAGTDYRMIRDLYWTSQYSPTGLTVDFTENRLYFIEAYQGTIESFDLDGGNRIEHHTAGHFPYPNDMTLLGDVVYWADLRSHSVERVNRTSWVRMIDFGWLGDNPVFGVVGYNASYQKQANTSCTRDNGQCSHLCLPTPTGRICACPNGVKLLSNNRNCSNVTSIMPPPQAPVVSVSLVDGQFPSEGRVEVNYQGITGTICDDYFGFEEAHVICRMLNYTRATHYLRRSYFGKGSGVIWLDSVKCKGNEKSISECQHAGWGENDCDHSEDIGVSCYNGTTPENVTSPYANTTGLKVRLLGSENEYEGRVEVFYGNEWGTICDYRWTLQDGHVVCRMLGYEGAWGAQGYAYFGRGSGKVMVSDVVCNGKEASIGSCYSSGWGSPTCNHDTDVSVTCKVHPSVLQDSRTLRLRDGLTPNEGRLEMKFSNKWGTICDDGWDMRDAHVACRELGYPGALSAPMRAAFGPGSGDILVSRLGCSGTETSLQSCSHSRWGAYFCFHSEDASVVCRTNNTVDPQTDASSFLLVADEKRDFLRQIIHQQDPTKHSSSPYVIQGMTNPDFVTIDPAARTVYVTRGGSIYMSHLFHNVTTRIIRQDQRISGLAVDYVCKKLYWSDYYGNKIMVSALDGSSTRGLVTVDSPKGIALDIRGGVMYYIGGLSSPKIYRSHMDGSNIKELLTLTSSSPTSIAHDSSNNIIYWSDTDKILYLNLSSDAVSAQMLSSVHVSSPYGITVHAGYIYWTDLKSGGFTGGLYRARLTSGSSHVTELVLSGFLTPRGVASLDIGNVLPENFACSSCHQCQQMCLRVPSGHQCMCTGMYHLTSDNATCVPHDFFASVEAYRETAEFVPVQALDGNEQRQTISLKKSKFPRAVEWDPVDHQIYYADTSNSHIARVYLNGTAEEIIISDVIQPRGLAIDHVGRHLYFTEFSMFSVSVCKLDGTYRKTLLVTQGNKPSSLAVYSEKGYLYWATWGGKSKIHRALMDGTQHTVLVEWIGAYESYGVTDMTIDKPTNRLYWVGWHDSSIESIDLTASTPMITQLRNYANYLFMPEGIELTSSKLCWTDRFEEGIFCGNRNGTASVESIVTGLYGIFGLKYCNGTPSPPSAHPCASDNYGQCSHLCLLKPNGYSCACPDVIPFNTSCSTSLPTTTAIPTSSPSTTVQHPTTNERWCESNPCLNGGTCITLYKQCVCPKYYVPKWSCEISIENATVIITLNGIDEEQVGNLELILREILVSILNPLNNTRRRRSADNHGQITVDNIFFPSPPKLEGNQVDVEVAVIYPSADGKITSSNIMPPQTLQKQITDSKPKINKQLQSTFGFSAVVTKVAVGSDSRKGSQTGQPSKMSKGSVAVVVVMILLIVIIAIALLIYFSRKRHQKRNSRDEDASAPDDFATFSNPSYGAAPPVADSMTMSPNIDSIYGMEAASNPVYETPMDNPGIESKTKMDNPGIESKTKMDNPSGPHYDSQEEAMEFSRRQNEYSDIPVASAEALPEHQYPGHHWENFDEPQYDNPHGDKLTFNINPGDESTL